MRRFPDITTKCICEIVREEGFQVSYSVVKRYVRVLHRRRDLRRVW